MPGANNSFTDPPTYGTVLANSFFGDQATEKDSSAEFRYDTPSRYPLRVGAGGYYYRRVATNNNTFGIVGENIPAGYVLNAIPSCASSRLVTVDGNQGVNLKGLRPPFSSDMTYNLSTEYRRPLPMRGDIEGFIRGDYRFESKQYSTVDNFAYYGPRNIFNLHIGVETKSWTAEVYALNLTNDQTPVTSQYNGSLNGFDPPPNGFFGVTWVPVSALPEGRTFAFKVAYRY